MSWHKIVIPEGDSGMDIARSITSSFECVFLAVLGAKEMALFETKLLTVPHVLYFTAGSEKYFGSIISAFSGVPCERPPRASVVPLVINGDPERFFL